jgi:uroporphyrinogen-III synthase
VVLNTRPREQAGELSALLALAGVDVVEAPAIATIPAWTDRELQSARLGLRTGAYQWVVIASRNAVLELLDELADARVVCGAATAAALGLHPALALERFSAGAALDMLRHRIAPGDRVLMPRAADGRDELADGLRALGADVHAPVAYRTVATADAAKRLREGGIDALVLCSPSAVASVAGALAGAELVICLGETTATAARKAGLRVDSVATSSNMPALVGAVQAALGVSV